jgi:hypothetical protein
LSDLCVWYWVYEVFNVFFQLIILKGHRHSLCWNIFVSFLICTILYYDISNEWLKFECQMLISYTWDTSFTILPYVNKTRALLLFIYFAYRSFNTKCQTKSGIKNARHILFACVQNEPVHHKNLIVNRILNPCKIMWEKC